MGHNTHTQQKVGWGGYLAFFITIILFSGMFAKSTEWWRVFDFTVLNGAFGQINAAGDTAVSFRGAGGMGAKDGFLFALELAPSVILSLGIISVTEGLGGLRAAQQLMTPVLRPLLGIPGGCSLALIANLQTSGSACITNYFSSGAALFTVVTVPVITPLAVILVFKFVGANLLRLWIAQLENRRMQQEA